MNSGLVINWWALALRGLLAVAFGVLAIVMPGLTLLTLVLLFGVFALLEGFFNAVGAFRASLSGGRWLPLLLQTLVGVAVGSLAIIHPGLTLLTEVYLIAFWSIATGVLEVVMAVRLRKEIKGEWLLALAGVASVAFGVLLLALPAVGVLTMALWLGGYTIFFGVLLLALALRLRLRLRARGTVRQRSWRVVPGM